MNLKIGYFNEGSYVHNQNCLRKFMDPGVLNGLAACQWIAHKTRDHRRIMCVHSWTTCTKYILQTIRTLVPIGYLVVHPTLSESRDGPVDPS